MKTTKFNESSILYAVATFNADPFLVEDEDLAAEILEEIEAHGAKMLDGEERIDALAKLNLEHTNRIVYKAGSCLFSMDDDVYTYDIYFHDETADNNIGCRDTYESCLDYIRKYNGTDEGYFYDYKGGTVAIYCNETEEEVYSENIPNSRDSMKAKLKNNITGEVVSVTSSTDHPDSSYGQPLWVDDDNNAYCVVGMPSPMYDVIEMEISNRVALGQYLKLLRTTSGISVRRLADMCELSPSTVQNIEKGSFSPRLDIIQKMADVLGVKITLTKQ